MLQLAYNKHENKYDERDQYGRRISEVHHGGRLRRENLPGCDLRNQLPMAEVGVDQFALYLPRAVIVEHLCNHEVTGLG
jgi:hypothetical protein